MLRESSKISNTDGIAFVGFGIKKLPETLKIPHLVTYFKEYYNVTFETKQGGNLVYGTRYLLRKSSQTKDILGKLQGREWVSV